MPDPLFLFLWQVPFTKLEIESWGVKAISSNFLSLSLSTVLGTPESKGEKGESLGQGPF